MWVFDPDSLRFLAVNRAAVEAYGWSRDEFLGMSIADIRPAEDVPAVRSALRDAERTYVAAGVWTHRKKDGSAIRVKVTSNAIDFEGRLARLVLVEDLTAQTRLEEQLRQAQKMEAIGRLAGSVAHDFNNILLVIRGHTAALIESLSDGSDRRHAEQVFDAAARGSEFAHQLLAFSRDQPLEPGAVDINAVVEEMVNMLGRLLGEIALDTRLDPGVAPVLIDRSRLAQAILNLVVNARDAMPDGGTLRIRTTDVELDEAYAQRHPDVAPGWYVMLQVTDSGVGMDESTRARMFEPYFTTKEGGSGIGLATVFGLVTQSHGSISVYSEPGIGTTFKLYLPRTDVHHRPAGLTSRSLGGTETILVVEDTEIVRALVEEMLGGYGYEVLVAATAEDALELVGQHRGAIDLLMTDVVLPDMSGRELAERVLTDDPSVRVLFSSGFPLESVLPHGLAPRHAFIEKPYLPAELADAIRSLLD